MYAEEEERSAIARRLSILPATIGLLGIVILVVGSSAAGVVSESRGWNWALFSAALVLATVVSGSATGLYAGLAVLGVGALTAGDDPTLAELTTLALTMLVVHETVRFSLDARRPSRFGPGFVGAYIARTVGLAALVIITMLATWPIATAEPRSTAWIPVGIAVAGLPLFALYGATLLDRFAPFAGPKLRSVAAVVTSVLIVLVVVVAAQARTSIDSGPVGSSTPTATPTATTAPRIIADTDPASIQRFVIFTAVMVAVLILGVLYLALRRPEAAFELDEIDPGIEDVSFGIAIPGTVDREDEVIEVDDQDLAQLLRDIQLDIETERDPGRAIRYGYATIERRLEDLAFTKQDSETEREFLTRVLPQLGDAGGAMTELTRLFEQARFSHETVDEAMRQRALGAIGDLLSHLDTKGGERS